MRLSMNDLYLFHEGLIDLMLKHKENGPKCKALNTLIERIRSECRKLAANYDMKKFRKLAEDFKKKYYENHSHCPACHNTKLTSTYIGYVVVVKEDGTVNESYKDENLVTCKCGWVGITHDLVACRGH